MWRVRLRLNIEFPAPTVLPTDYSSISLRGCSLWTYCSVSCVFSSSSRRKKYMHMDLTDKIGVLLHRCQKADWKDNHRADCVILKALAEGVYLDGSPIPQSELDRNACRCRPSDY